MVQAKAELGNAGSGTMAAGVQKSETAAASAGSVTVTCKICSLRRYSIAASTWSSGIVANVVA